MLGPSHGPAAPPPGSLSVCLMLSLLFVFFITAAYGVFLGCILDVPGSGIRKLETGVETLVSVSMTVVDARTVPWSGRTTPWKSFRLSHPRKCPEPGTGHIKNATKKDTRGGSDKEYKNK